MRSVAMVVALCGCNPIFDVRETVHLDAGVPPDAPPDAAPSCPPIGSVPQFTSSLHQAVPQRCLDYSIGWNGRIALALCQTSDRTYQHHEGRVDDTMSRARGDLFSTATFYVRTAVLASDRLEAFVYLTNIAFTMSTITIWRRELDGAWLRGPDTNLPIRSDYTSPGWFTNPTAAPRRILVGGGGIVDEYLEDDTGTWTPQASYDVPTDFELIAIGEGRLSSDGLRLVFRGVPAGGVDPRVYYTDRASTAERFGRPSPLLTIPTAPLRFGASMTEDCGRIYFSGLDSVFYARQP